jgi:RNA polymerase sigma-32 factor
MDRLVEASLRYVVAVAVQYRRYGIRLSELVAEGNLGLMMAVRKFDPDRGTRFVTYAGYWIRATILDAVTRSSTLVGGGAGPLRTKLFFRLRRERSRVANLTADPVVRLAMLAERFGVTEERMAEMMRRVESKDVSLDSTMFDDSETTLLDRLPHPAPAQDQVLADAEHRVAISTKLEKALRNLDRRERYIIEQRTLSDGEVSLADLGRRLGVSRERARQLEARAKKKLQKELAELDPAA